VPFYFSPPGPAGARQAMLDGHIGAIATPAQGNRLDGLPAWAADNGCFLPAKYVGDDALMAWLERLQPIADRCWFAVAPDVVGDAAATLARSEPFLAPIRALGYPAALVAQNGLEDLAVPWDDFDVLFIGGDTAWKLGPAARDLAAQARHRGKDVHMGRVNSLRRLRYADAIGCTSADGTYLRFGPDINLPALLSWTRNVRDQLTLFSPP
jgi:hypothetical protein